MSTRQTTSAYRSATAEGATLSGLLQLVYSHLAQDLLRAADAVRRNDIQARCDASNHALSLLAHLESWADDSEEPQLADSLRSFYRMLLRSILRLQVAPDAAMFDQAARLVLDTRAAWQAKEESLSALASESRTLPRPEGVVQSISFHA